MFILVFALVAVVAASTHVAFSSKRRSSGAAIADTYLVYLLFIFVGLMGLLLAYAHIFRPVQTSAAIGRLPSPYEFQAGMADLTAGVLGLLCLWLRGDFWLATAIANAVSMMGNAAGHIREIRLHPNHAYNSPVVIFAECVLSLVIFFLALYHRRTTSGRHAE